MATTGAAGTIGGVNDTVQTRSDRIYFYGFTTATLNGSTEHIWTAPAGGKSYSWRLKDIILSVGVNTTHDTAASITVTAEKNTDGGTSALTTAPVITNAAGTGVASTAEGTVTGITPTVVKTTSDAVFDPGQTCFFTLTEAGSGGTDPSDVSFVAEFERVSNFTPTA